MKPIALFLGKQIVKTGVEFSLFNINGGEHHGSTVTVPTLQKLGIEVPLSSGALEHELQMINEIYKTEWNKL